VRAKNDLLVPAAPLDLVPFLQPSELAALFQQRARQATGGGCGSILP
jgi:hypothetical protein